MQETQEIGSTPGSGRSLESGNGNPLQYSCLENPMDRGAWWATVWWVTKSWTRLSTQAHTHRHYYGSLISNPWENAAAVCTGKLGITVNLLCIKSTRSDNDSLQVRASCLALYSSLTEGKRQGCYPALYPPHCFSHFPCFIQVTVKSSHQDGVEKP